MVVPYSVKRYYFVPLVCEWQQKSGVRLEVTLILKRKKFDEQRRE